VTYSDTWTAQTLETPGGVGKHPVATMTFVRSQKLSNGATSKAEVAISPDVPGGTVGLDARAERERADRFGH